MTDGPYGRVTEVDLPATRSSSRVPFGSVLRIAFATVTVMAAAFLTIGASVPAGSTTRHSGAARSRTATLDGEVLTAPFTTISTGTGCGQQQAGSPTFAVSGVATGPYPGTFTETGSWSFDLISEQTFETSFTITSGSKVLSGILLYDVTSTGPDGKSLVQNLGSCSYSVAGGAYSTCAQQQLTGACAGQSVAFIYADSFYQSFSKPSGAYTMTITGGNDQTAGLSTSTFSCEFPQPIAVQVTDANGAPVPGVIVTWRTSRSPATGAPAGPWTGTDWHGDASVNVFCGYAAGTFSITAKGSKGTHAVFTLTGA